MEKLNVLWTSGDREFALKMIFMYTKNSRLKGWWKEVRLIVWGPSAKLLTEDAELQEQVSQIKHVGVEVVACKACADAYGVADALVAMGIDVKYMGESLTQLLKQDEKLITV